MRKAKICVHGVFAGWLEEINPGEDYRFRYTGELKDLPYSAAEQRLEAVRRAKKMSIQGVQPKVSAVLDVKRVTLPG